MKKRKKSIIKLIILVIIIAIAVVISNFTYGKITKNKFKKILVNNNYTNYELTEFSNDEETNVKVRDKILLSENGNIRTWVSELDEKRIVMDTNSQIAIITEDDNELKVNTLNYTYINDYFENSNQRFKYLGKKDGCYLLQFTNKQTEVVTCLYLNIKTNLVEKKIDTAANGAEFISEFKIDVNSVSKSEVAFPDLTDYHIQDSASSGMN